MIYPKIALDYRFKNIADLASYYSHKPLQDYEEKIHINVIRQQVKRIGGGRYNKTRGLGFILIKQIYDWD